MRVKNPSSVAFVFQLFLTIQGKTTAALLWLFSDFCSKALQYIIEYNHAHTPGPAWPAHAAESGPRARLQVLQNSGSRMFMFRVKTLSARDRHWRNPKKKKAQQYKKRVCQCTDGLSATQNGHGAAEGFSTVRESNPSRPTLCNSSLILSHWFMSFCRKNRYMTRHITWSVSQPATAFLRAGLSI